MTLDHLAHLAADSARFRAALLLTEPADRVPSCPDWDADDLLWHLAEVQWFWGTIAAQRLSDPDVAEGQKPGRPASREGLLAYFDESTELLQRALRETAPEVEVWTWSDDHSIGFIRRRQAHEALIHRLDAELTAGVVTPLDANLAEDGVDEVLRVMYGGDPGWGTFTATPGHTLRVAVAGSSRSWVATLGRFTGTSPDGDTTYEDEPDMRIAEVDDGAPAVATVSGGASDLDRWLWRRPLEGEVTRSGDPETLAAFEAAISSGID